MSGPKFSLDFESSVVFYIIVNCDVYRLNYYYNTSQCDQNYNAKRSLEIRSLKKIPMVLRTGYVLRSLSFFSRNYRRDTFLSTASYLTRWIMDFRLWIIMIFDIRFINGWGKNNSMVFRKKKKSCHRVYAEVFLFTFRHVCNMRYNAFTKKKKKPFR